MLPNAARRLPLQRRVTPHTQKTPFSAFSYNIYPKKLLNHSSAKYDLFAFTPALQDFIHLPNYLRATHYKVHNNILNHLSAKYSKRHICPVRAFLICIAVSFFMQTYSIYRTPYKPTHPSAPLNTTPTQKRRPHPFNPVLAQRSKLFSKQAHRVRLPRQGFPHRKLYILTVASPRPSHLAASPIRTTQRHPHTKTPPSPF